MQGKSQTNLEKPELKCTHALHGNSTRKCIEICSPTYSLPSGPSTSATSYLYHSIPMHWNEFNKNKVEIIYISEKTGESWLWALSFQQSGESSTKWKSKNKGRYLSAKYLHHVNLWRPICNCYHKHIWDAPQSCFKNLVKLDQFAIITQTW